MANASRPKRFSQPKTSNRSPRGLSPKGTVPASTGTPKRSSRKSVNPPKVDPLELYVTLVAGAENLSVNAANGLLRLRRVQLAAREGARGALIRVERRKDGRFDLERSALESPLLGDFFDLLVLQLISDFPKEVARLRRLLAARRTWLDIKTAYESVMGDDSARTAARNAQKHTIDAGLCFWLTQAALKPLREALALSIRRHHKKRFAPDMDCPVCGFSPYAILGRRFCCYGCETQWPKVSGYCHHCGDPEDLQSDGAIHIAGAEWLKCGKCGDHIWRFDKTLTAAFQPSWPVQIVRYLDNPKRW